MLTVLCCVQDEYLALETLVQRIQEALEVLSREPAPAPPADPPKRRPSMVPAPPAPPPRYGRVHHPGVLPIRHFPVRVSACVLVFV